MDNNSLDKIGRQMPYRVPDSFFDDFENRIIAGHRRRTIRHRVKMLLLPLGAVAAIAILLLTVRPAAFNPATGYAEIAQAFDDLSEADRTCLLDTYQDDIFINQ